MASPLAPHRVLAAYSLGIFPMADDTGRIHWLAPDPRAIIEIGAIAGSGSFKISRSLRAVVRRGVFEITINRSFTDVVHACADRTTAWGEKEGTWISQEIAETYEELHAKGFAHSVEAWKDGALVGGLYGVSIGGAFFGESMFHRVTDASKVALVHLVERMQARGFLLLDVQFQTDHLKAFGAVEIPRAEYERRLASATGKPCSFWESSE